MKKLEFPHALIQVAILNSLRKAHFIASLYFAWCKSRHDILVPPYLFGAVARVWVEANQSTRTHTGRVSGPGQRLCSGYHSANRDVVQLTKPSDHHALALIAFTPESSGQSVTFIHVTDSLNVFRIEKRIIPCDEKRKKRSARNIENCRYGH